MIKKLIIIATLVTLASCVTAPRKRVSGEKPAVTVEAIAKMTDSIFLEPLSKDQQIVYVEVSNTSENAVNLEEALKAAIMEKGYRLAYEPNEAYFMFKVDITQAGKPEGATGYAILANVEISQKITTTKKRKVIRSKNYREEDGWRKYTTSAISTTTNGNADFSDAEPSLVGALVGKIVEVL